ncbi:hypothetical protein [Nocardioides sp. P86]|uniref:hypothetical protein n=1 Tax=Nocardioides sp. P86 TaxID=2939569 RepID=UPI00203F90B8|nr:hypothetical protein [Nocardioides sp. P86]MCM3513996.1 hypothetical protein [Nocardioides sp. P86]
MARAVVDRSARWAPWRWARASHERAVRNAREGATDAARRRLERAEVELFLATPRTARRAQHPA